MRIKVVIVIPLIILVGCKDEFPVISPNQEEILVIEGGITNLPGPYFVRLSLSSPLIQPFQAQKRPYPGCIVAIFDNIGNSDILTETGAGVYETAPDGIHGQPGLEYHVEVITPDNRKYSTLSQPMPESVGIDTLLGNLTVHEQMEYPYQLPGIQFYVSTNPAANRESYILWNLWEDYQYNADYKLYSLLFNDNMFYQSIEADKIASITGINYDSVYTCWSSDFVSDFYIGKLSNLVEPVIKMQPLHFVSTKSKKLSVRYSLLLKQYSIGEDAYYYWKNVKEQVSHQDFLRTKQPYSIAGNLKNIDNPDELTLGYFTVGSLVEKRIYIEKPNVIFYYPVGFFGTESPPKVQPNYWALQDGMMGYAHKDCFDCRTEGGTIRRPDFWVDF